MKKAKRWRTMLLGIICLTLMIACGGDDGGSKQETGGVNVASGKKMVKLTYSTSSNNIMEYQIAYDSKGRLAKIDYTEGTYKVNDFVIIDYDLHVIRIADWITFNFSLNDNGYISKMGSCVLSYENGYLTRVDEKSGISTLAYDANELIKASVPNLRTGQLSLLYVSYGNTDNKGELYINVKRHDNYSYNYGIPSTYFAFFIAYQSGLFGKVSKTFMHMKDKSESSAIIDYATQNNQLNGKIEYVLE